MSFLVKDISNVIQSTAVSLPSDKALGTHRYPDRNQSSSRFHTTIFLYDYEHLPASIQTTASTFLTYFFRETYTHCVLLIQSTAAEKEKIAAAWVLCETTNEVDGKEALVEIKQTLTPLVRDGSVLLSHDLLDAVIIPCPVPHEEVTSIVLEMIETNPSGHEEWPAVVQALLQNDSKTRYDKDPKTTASNVVAEQRRKSVIHKEISLNTAAKENRCESIRRMLVTQASRKRFGSVLDEINTPDASITSLHLDDEDIFYDFDAVDEESHNTPLYTSIQKGYYKSSLFLLLGGANPNFVHPLTGNTCLHHAAEQGSVMMIKLLFTFHANANIRNVNGKKPIDVLADIPEYEEVQCMFKEIEKLNEENKRIPCVPVEISTKDGQFLLTFDGGGSRCISEVQTLIAIEKRMAEINPNCRPFMDHFDYVAGTSGGAFHALCLIYNGLTLMSDRALVVNGASYNEGNSLYEKTRNIERLIKNTLGEVKVMADVTAPKCIITATLANTIPPKLHLVTNYGEARDGKAGPKDRKIWEAARMSSAAPTYFMSYDNFIDGGIMANNPTVDAIVEMNEQSMKNDGCPLKLSCVLSLGSGQDKPMSVENIDVSGSSYGIKGLAEKVDGYKNLMTLIISQVTQAEGQDIARAKALCDLSGGVYYRLTAPVGKAIALDTSDPMELIQPMFDSFMYTLRNPQLIDSVARTLLSNPKLY